MWVTLNVCFWTDFSGDGVLFRALKDEEQTDPMTHRNRSFTFGVLHRTVRDDATGPLLNWTPKEVCSSCAVRQLEQEYMSASAHITPCEHLI